MARAAALRAPLAPGSRIGILGGGQLGRMTAMAAARLGYHCHVYCPEGEAPALQVVEARTIAPYDDGAALDAFAAAADVVTFEFENVPAAALRRLEAKVPVRPGWRALHIAQNRLREKEFLSRIEVRSGPSARSATRRRSRARSRRSAVRRCSRARSPATTARARC
jgi:5-(carboxyamino)imidazole ribonucleotide synthase